MENKKFSSHSQRMKISHLIKFIGVGVGYVLDLIYVPNSFLINEREYPSTFSWVRRLKPMKYFKLLNH